MNVPSEIPTNGGILFEVIANSPPSSEPKKLIAGGAEIRFRKLVTVFIKKVDWYRIEYPSHPPNSIDKQMVINMT